MLRNDFFGLVSGAQHGWKVYWKPVTFHFIDVLNPGTFMCLEIFLSSCALYSFCSWFKHVISKLLLVDCV